MKYCSSDNKGQRSAGRSPCRERGLKYHKGGNAALLQWSLPVQGAWIEIFSPLQQYRTMRSLPVQGAWIEIIRAVDKPYRVLSLPVQGAWIEMPL